MEKNNIVKRIVESFIIFPIATLPMSFGALPQTGASVVATLQGAQENISGFEEVLKDTKETLEEQILNLKAQAIDSYFKSKDMPLEGMGRKMVIESEKNNIDWRLLAAISVRESTGGKHACKKVDYSAFGWGSCKINFESYEQAIEVVAKNLGGNNPKTARHYSNKTTVEILRAYNPPSIVPKYAEQVMAIMNTIGNKEVNLEVAMNQ